MTHHLPPLPTQRTDNNNNNNRSTVIYVTYIQ
jgi:hypothetical protein